MQVKLVEKYPFTVYNSDAVKNIGTIAARQMEDIGVRQKWTLLVDKSAATGANSIEFWYKVADNNWVKAGGFHNKCANENPVLAINQIITDKIV